MENIKNGTAWISIKTQDIITGTFFDSSRGVVNQICSILCTKNSYPGWNNFKSLVFGSSIISCLVILYHI